MVPTAEPKEGGFPGKAPPFKIKKRHEKRSELYEAETRERH